MSTLEDKLRENRNRRRREVLISSINDRFKELMLRVQYSHDVSAIRFAAFATWDGVRNDWTTTRGAINTWKKYDFGSWGSLLLSLEEISASFSISEFGWLFFEVDGPYYKVTNEEFIGHLQQIAAYAESTDECSFGWVGADRDIGIIVEFEHTFFCKNDFCLCTWQT